MIKRFKEWLRERLMTFLFGKKMPEHSIRTEVKPGDVVIFWLNEPISQEMLDHFKKQFEPLLNVRVIFLPISIGGPQILGKGEQRCEEATNDPESVCRSMDSGISAKDRIYSWFAKGW